MKTVIKLEGTDNLAALCAEAGISQSSDEIYVAVDGAGLSNMMMKNAVSAVGKVLKDVHQLGSKFLMVFEK